ncbi:MAG: hypothetical protein IPJ82_06295 [Lewinellaceae bacterium]|nr:hypothetical protein [Lewinellaceae bacterium]
MPTDTFRYFAKQQPLLLLLVLLAPPLLCAQGPLDGYLKGKGVLDLAPSFSFQSAAEFAGPGGQTFDLPYKGSMLGLFAEYGVSQRLDLVGTAAYVFTEAGSGLQDGGLFVKYRPFYKEIRGGGRLGVLAGIGAGFPLADYKPLITGALGQKAVTVPFRLILQWETPAGLFFNVTGGYHWRLDRLDEKDIATIKAARPDYQPIGPKNFSTLLCKTGFPSKHYYLDAWVEWQHTSGGANYVPGVPDLPQAYGVSYTQAGGTIYYSESGKNGIYLSGAYTLAGRNTSRILRLTIGMVVKL